MSTINNTFLFTPPLSPWMEDPFEEENTIFKHETDGLSDTMERIHSSKIYPMDSTLTSTTSPKDCIMSDTLKNDTKEVSHKYIEKVIDTTNIICCFLKTICTNIPVEIPSTSTTSTNTNSESCSLPSPQPFITSPPPPSSSSSSNATSSLEKFVANILIRTKLSDTFVYVALLYIHRYLNFMNNNKTPKSQSIVIEDIQDLIEKGEGEIEMEDDENKMVYTFHDFTNAVSKASLKNKPFKKRSIKRKVKLPRKICTNLNNKTNYSKAFLSVKNDSTISKKINNRCLTTATKTTTTTTKKNSSLYLSSPEIKFEKEVKKEITTPPSSPQWNISQKDLIFAAMICSSKYLDDNSYCNTAWVKLTDKTLDEVLDLEREFLTALDHQLYFSNKEWKEWFSWITWFKTLVEKGMQSEDSLIISLPSQQIEQGFNYFTENQGIITECDYDDIYDMNPLHYGQTFDNNKNNDLNNNNINGYENSNSNCNSITVGSNDNIYVNINPHANNTHNQANLNTHANNIRNQANINTHINVNTGFFGNLMEQQQQQQQQNINEKMDKENSFINTTKTINNNNTFPCPSLFMNSTLDYLCHPTTTTTTTSNNLYQHQEFIPILENEASMASSSIATNSQCQQQYLLFQQDYIPILDNDISMTTSSSHGQQQNLPPHYQNFQQHQHFIKTSSRLNNNNNNNNNEYMSTKKNHYSNINFNNNNNNFLSSSGIKTLNPTIIKPTTLITTKPSILTTKVTKSMPIDAYESSIPSSLDQNESFVKNRKPQSSSFIYYSPEEILDTVAVEEEKNEKENIFPCKSHLSSQYIKQQQQLPFFLPYSQLKKDNEQYNYTVNTIDTSLFAQTQDDLYFDFSGISNLQQQEHLLKKMFMASTSTSAPVSAPAPAPAPASTTTTALTMTMTSDPCSIPNSAFHSSTAAPCISSFLPRIINNPNNINTVNANPSTTSMSYSSAPIHPSSSYSWSNLSKLNNYALTTTTTTSIPMHTSFPIANGSTSTTTNTFTNIINPSLFNPTLITSQPCSLFLPFTPINNILV